MATDYPTSPLPASMEWGLVTRTQTFESPLSGSVQTLELPGAARWRAVFTYDFLSVAQQRMLFSYLASLKGMAGRSNVYDFSLTANRGSMATTGTPAVNGGTAAVNNGGGYPGGTTVVAVNTGTRKIEIGEYVKFAGHSTKYLVAGSTMSGSPSVGNLTFSSPGLTAAVTNAEVLTVFHTGATLRTDGWTINSTGILLAGDYFSVNGELKMITSDASSNSSGGSTLSFQPSLRDTPADNLALDLVTPTCQMMLANDEQTKMSIRSPVLASFTVELVEAFL